MSGVGAWLVTGAVPGVIAPGLLVLTRWRGGWLELPPALAATAFVILHGVITVSLLAGFGPLPWLGLHLLLLAGALTYWWPLRRLDGAGRFLYLFLSSPLLDLAGVVVVALGHPDDGIAMIIGMLPLNAAAVAVTWQWLAAEERAAEENASDGDGDPIPPPAVRRDLP